MMFHRVTAILSHGMGLTTVRFGLPPILQSLGWTQMLTMFQWSLSGLFPMVPNAGTWGFKFYPSHGKCLRGG